jgi:hypothetical protein
LVWDEPPSPILQSDGDLIFVDCLTRARRFEHQVGRPEQSHQNNHPA